LARAEGVEFLNQKSNDDDDDDDDDHFFMPFKSSIFFRARSRYLGIYAIIH
jgi:hypothetical protein